MEDYYDLGSHHRDCSTDDEQAQRWFDRGLVWTYGFNHEEGAACFERAIGADPDLALAHWGLAYALGPNYNKPWEFFDAEDLASTLHRTHAAVTRAQELAAGATPVEQALIGALQHRYPDTSAVGDWSVWNTEYAAAMGEVYERFPEDLDVATLYADALMNLTPWQLWDLPTGAPAPGSRAMDAKRVIEQALDGDAGRQHPGLLHMYIHLMEMSATPEVALPAADRLRDLVPDAGHLRHMPTHLDVLCGDYRRAIASNSEAIVADEKFLARSGAMNFYTLYRCHDYHFRIYAALFLGQSRVALETVSALEATISEQLLRVESPPMADWLEGFLAMRVHALVRFGRWGDVLDLPLPGDGDLYCTTTAMTHYARGVALAATGRVEDASTEQVLFEAAVARVPATRTLFNNTCVDILGIAREMLAGELEYRRGNHDLAFAHLRRSVELDDTLPYDEPWGWMQPTRPRPGRPAARAGPRRAGRCRLRRGPRPRRHPAAGTGETPTTCGRLHGYHECLTSAGAGPPRLASSPGSSLSQQRWRTSPSTASCFCRVAAVTDGADGPTAAPRRGPEPPRPS